MDQTRVAQLLNKIHSSKPLLTMLKRMEMEPITPEIMLNKINASLSREVLTHHVVRKALTYLEDHIPNLDSRFLLSYMVTSTTITGYYLIEMSYI